MEMSITRADFDQRVKEMMGDYGMSEEEARFGAAAQLGIIPGDVVPEEGYQVEEPKEDDSAH
jgi:hypothetical protein